jgi:hypothetical protein
MKIHEIKCWPVFFEHAIKGLKSFEIRINDRDYKVGDMIRVREYDKYNNLIGKYTGSSWHTGSCQM